MTDASKGRDWINNELECLERAEAQEGLTEKGLNRLAELRSGKPTYTQVQNELKAVREELAEHEKNGLAVYGRKIELLQNTIAEINAENVRILKLAEDLDLYTIHSRAMDGCRLNRDFKHCDCGLDNLQKQLKALATIGEK